MAMSDRAEQARMEAAHRASTAPQINAVEIEDHIERSLRESDDCFPQVQSFGALGFSGNGLIVRGANGREFVITIIEQGWGTV